MKSTKYIFVTGGVASSLGKGIISSSIGKLLQARGYNITIQKFDPYINVDSGTLNPNEHGESYVTIDGHQGDLDLGHYERFTGIEVTRTNNITTGRIYQNVIERERRGEYLGKTIQVVPHITNEIKHQLKFLSNKGDYDFIITEIGGTVGDIEGLPFLEAIRQYRREIGMNNAVNVHLTYVPYLSAAGELKTKPTQHSVKELQRQGIQPDILVLRTEHPLEQGLCNKVASFCNVDADCVVQSIDLPTIYEVPVKMQEQGLDKAILRKLGMEIGETPTLGPWKDFLNRRSKATEVVNIALVGKYTLQDAYKSILEALQQAGTYNDRKVKTHFILSDKLTDENIAESLKGMDGVIIGPGNGPRGHEGKIVAAKYCRENDIPTFGICLGMQMMVIEFARNVLGLKNANTTEYDTNAADKVIDLMDELKSRIGVEGALRKGGFECQLDKDSRAFEAYRKENVVGRHFHRYELNNEYKKALEEKGLKCTGINQESGLVEIVEVPACKWYVGIEFHAEYGSTVLKPNPLFVKFIEAAIKK